MNPEQQSPEQADMLRRIENMRRMAQEKEGREQQNKKPITHNGTEMVQLPLWGEATSGTPNSFLRGALFAAIQGKEREYIKGQLLATREGIKIRFTGMQLDQSDLEVWEQAAELCRSHPLGNICHFTIHGFLKSLGRNTGKRDHEWLKDVFRRLGSSLVEITHGRYTYGGSMLEFIHDEKDAVYMLHLNSSIISMYKAGWTAIDLETRRKLRRKPLALWTHGYLSSDAENYSTKVETIHHLSGSKTKELRKFKQNFKAALADLETATDGSMGGTIDENNLVSWKRQPTATQIRHLAKKTRKNPKR